jgi:hypothetical protein
MRSLLTILALIAVAACAFAQTDRDVLIEGVEQIAAPGLPGAVCVFGAGAFPVVVGKDGGQQEAVVAAGTAGASHCVAFGHTGYLDAPAMKIADTGRLMRNVIRWCARGKEPKVAGVGVDGLIDWLREQGLAAQALTGQDWPTRLGDSNVLIFRPAQASTQAERTAIRDFMEHGGGLIGATTGWGWLQLNPTKQRPADHPGHRLMEQAGLLWADGGLDKTSPEGFDAKAAPSPLINVTAALDALEAQAKGERTLTKEELAQASFSVTRAARALAPDDTLLMPRLRALQEAHATEAVPTAAKPLAAENALARLALTLQLQDISELPPDQVKAHPAAAAFPGEVPAEAPRVTRSVGVDTAVPGWHSTGLYAAPGEVITVTVPADAAGKGVGVRIGCHSDRLWNLPSWKRVPDICRQVPLAKETTTIANAFGGLVYVTVPGDGKLGTVTAQIAGAVEAPRFVLGRTDPVTWREAIRSLPGPWAELECSKVILTVPSSDIRALDDPVRLMEFWTHVLDADAELSGRPIQRDRPERIVADVQISAGFMHSGYPIMTWLVSAPVAVDLKKLRTEGSWGHFHELGHNHQSGDWTFNGATEVTVNLFSLYCIDRCCDFGVYGHGNVSPEKRADKTKAYLDAGAKFDDWKKDPFLALCMYMQLQEAFGWEAFKRVFAEYRALPDAERPKTDDEKRDQWLVRFSRTVGRNLGPFFQTWGVPTSEQARKSIEDLPVWMPEGLPTKP